MRVRYLQTVLTLATLSLAGSASAHLELLQPPPRLPAQANGGQVKIKPCGQSENGRTQTVTTFKPGETIQVKIREYVDHPGYFAVAFDPDGDDDFPFPIDDEDAVVAATDNPRATFPLSDTVLGFHLDAVDGNCAASPDKTCTITVKLPNIQCQSCTLQVIQFMYDKLGDGGKNEYYYQCADLKLEGELMPGGGGGAGGSGASEGGSGGASAGSGGATAGTGGATAGATSGGTDGAGTGGMSAVAGGGGAPSGSGSGNGPGTAGSGAPQPPASTTDEGGCSVARVPAREGALLSLAGGLLLGLGWLARRRDRA